MFRACLLNAIPLLVAARYADSGSTLGKDDQLSASRGGKKDGVLSNLDVDLDRLKLIVNGRRPGKPLTYRLFVTADPQNA
jgi:hypothetical protein